MVSDPSVKRVLLVAASPRDATCLRLDEEFRAITDAVERAPHRDKFLLDKHGALRSENFRRKLFCNPQIVHFSGHGKGTASSLENTYPATITDRVISQTPEIDTTQEGLILEDDLGHSKLVNSQALAGLFELCKDHVECVVLNSCYSVVQAKAIALHIPYVIGMRRAIGDKAAINFSIGFYDALGAGRSVEVAFQSGCNSIQLEGLPEHLTPVLIVQWMIVFAGTSNHTITAKTQSTEALVQELEQLAGDEVLFVQETKSDNTRIVLASSIKTYYSIKKLYEVRDLTELCGLQIIDISNLKKFSNAVKIFVAYAPRDMALCEELIGHLEPMVQNKEISVYYDNPNFSHEEFNGEGFGNVKAELEKQLNSSQIILFLVSPAFISSGDCQSIVERTIAQHSSNKTCIIPVILRACAWEQTLYGGLKPLPSKRLLNGLTMPVVGWSDRDEAFLNVVQGIRSIVRRLREQ